MTAGLLLPRLCIGIEALKIRAWVAVILLENGYSVFGYGFLWEKCRRFCKILAKT